MDGCVGGCVIPPQIVLAEGGTSGVALSRVRSGNLSRLFLMESRVEAPRSDKFCPLYSLTIERLLSGLLFFFTIHFLDGSFCMFCNDQLRTRRSTHPSTQYE